MTKSYSANELAKLANVSVRAIYQWINACPELREKLGELNDGGRFSLADAQRILRVHGRSELATLIGELALAQEFLPSIPEPEFMGEVVLETPPHRGRQKKDRIPTWVSIEYLAGGTENSERLRVALYRANAEIEMIRDVAYVALENLPEDILAPFVARLKCGSDELEAFRASLANKEGELWISGKAIAAALGWTSSLVATRGWRTPWTSRPHQSKNGRPEGLEYELSSLPEELRIPILRYLKAKAA
jgi:hypothetical protein